MKTIPVSLWHGPPPGCIAASTDGVNWTVYESGDTPPQPAASTSRILSTPDFRVRFTDTELGGMAMSGDANVRVMLLKISTTNEIDLESLSIVNGLKYLVSKGLLTEARRLEIMV